jgi:hypothetical protein
VVEIPTPKPYIFMIMVTRQIKCLIAQVPGVIPHPLPEVNFLVVEISTPKPYIFILIINIYGLGVGISTIKKFTSDRGGYDTPRGLSYKAFNLPSHPDHKYIWLRGGDLNH